MFGFDRSDDQFAITLGMAGLPGFGHANRYGLTIGCLHFSLPATILVARPLLVARRHRAPPTIVTQRRCPRRATRFRGVRASHRSSPSSLPPRPCSLPCPPDCHDPGPPAPMQGDDTHREALGGQHITEARGTRQAAKDARAVTTMHSRPKSAPSQHKDNVRGERKSGPHWCTRSEAGDVEVYSVHLVDTVLLTVYMHDVISVTLSLIILFLAYSAHYRALHSYTLTSLYFTSRFASSLCKSI
ncbi:hypothetical protein C8J57DRAFT_1729228 [Mycena rebaudengoi]|nr:hypothetical protein C8J57DRAFT_1729228 [Mycena rebaudengoi]